MWIAAQRKLLTAGAEGESESEVCLPNPVHQPCLSRPFEQRAGRWLEDECKHQERQPPSIEIRIATFRGRLSARLFTKPNAPQSKRLIFIFPRSLERVVLYCNPRTKVRVHPSILLESSNALIFTSTDSHCLHSLRDAFPFQNG